MKKQSSTAGRMPSFLRMPQALLFACALWVTANSMQGQVQKQRLVVVISLDGFPAYALDDPRLPVPTLRRLAQEGATAAAMQPINPTVTWPNHTAMVTGVNASKHQVLFNGSLTRPATDAPVVVQPWRDKDLLVHAPTVYDVAYNAGLTTAQVDWVAIYGARTITWQFPERPNPDGTIEKEVAAKGLVTHDQLATFMQSSPAWRDKIWTDVAADILKTHQPNLMLFHLLDLDAANHKYGPMSNASMTAMAFMDDQVKQIFDTLQNAGLLDRTTIIIVSDHGFREVKHVIHPNVMLKSSGLLKSKDGKVVCDAWVVSEGGVAMAYVTNPSRRAELIPRLRDLFANVEGVARIYGQNDFAQVGLPASGQSDQSPDLLLAAKPDYSFQDGSEGPLITEAANDRLALVGTHGYLNTDSKMNAIFIAWGNGIQQGVRLNSILNVDVAPTIAALLGLDMPQVDGHVLRQILK
jgi:predicted AlkP superfamily pyrophosphatase or phosphodiesterase